MIDDRDRSDWSRLTNNVELPTFLRWATRDDVKPVEVVEPHSFLRPFRMSWHELYGILTLAGVVGFIIGYFAAFHR